MTIEGESDVLIVGAGPTGCAAGIALQRAGFEVCVVDAAQFPRDKVCGDALSSAAMQTVDELGAGSALRRGPHAVVRGAAALFPDGTRIERRYTDTGCIVPRLHLDDCLRQALEASGARLEQRCRVSELTHDGERVAGARGPSLRWKAALVIAADGYGSVGLKTLGTAVPRGRQLAVSATAYYRDVRFPNGPHTSDHYFEDEVPYGYSWIFPAVAGLSNVGVYIRADAYADTGHKLKTMLDDFIARHPDRFAGAQRVGERRSWSLPLAPRAMPLSAPGLLLAGDAAGFIDPLSGEGIWQALASGSLAGDTAAAALRANGLSSRLQRDYAAACARTIMNPSRRKAWVQQGMQWILDRKLYANPAIRAALRWGYSNQLLEMTKS